MAFALAVVSTLSVASIHSVRADDGCDAWDEDDYCEYDSSGGYEEYGGDDEYGDSEPRKCGDYTKSICGGTTTVTTYTCTRWKLVDANGSFTLHSTKPSASAGFTVQCAAHTTTVRTIQNRWDRAATVE
jgi:hypothetical protein